MREKMPIERRVRIIFIFFLIVLVIFICVKLKERYFTENKDASVSGRPNTNMSADEIYKAVLLGETSFRYSLDGKMETITITDLPSLFDAEDSFMKIWEFAVADLNGDGEDEVILFVVGAAGDTGGKVILHQSDNQVYGYLTDNRTLVDLKIDGTFNFTDPTGVTEAGIAAITNFTKEGYTIDKISYETGTYKGWDTFVVDHRHATEKEYLNMVSEQDKKQNVEWYDFNNEYIITMF